MPTSISSFIAANAAAAAPVVKTITISFTTKQFEALKFLLTEADDAERQYVSENYDEYEYDAEHQLTHLNQIGAGKTAFANIQRVWNAINQKDEVDEPECPGCLSADCEQCGAK